MEEYFARQRRRRLLGAACSLVVFAAVFVVALFAMFRTHSNYQFRSIADFFYQTLLAPAQLDYEFVDQNVSEAQIGPYTIRTMSIQVGEDTRLVQAVAVPSFFGKYYRFSLLQADKYYGTKARSLMEVYEARYTLIALPDGLLVHVLASQEYEDGGIAESISTYGEDYDAEIPKSEHCQYFWLPADNLPDQYTITGGDTQTTFMIEPDPADLGEPQKFRIN